MNTKAILASLFVIGSSTVALADPMGGVTVRDHRDADDVTVQVRDHRDQDGDHDHDVKRLPVWTVLSSQDKLATGRTSVRVSSRRDLSKLRLTATGGSTEIEKIQIKFTNGRSEIVAPDQMIDASNPSLTVNLSYSTQVRSIVVFGHANRRASFEILGA